MSESVAFTPAHCVTAQPEEPPKFAITIPPGWSWDQAVCLLEEHGKHVALGSADQLLDRVLNDLGENRTFCIRVLSANKELEILPISRSDYKRGQGACRVVAERKIEAHS